MVSEELVGTNPLQGEMYRLTVESTHLKRELTRSTAEITRLTAEVLRLGAVAAPPSNAIDLSAPRDYTALEGRIISLQSQIVYVNSTFNIGWVVYASSQTYMRGVVDTGNFTVREYSRLRQSGRTGKSSGGLFFLFFVYPLGAREDIVC